MYSDYQKNNRPYQRSYFEPEDIANMRASFDRAWDALPRERRTFDNMDAMAVAIVRSATCGERDPGRLSARALDVIAAKAPAGAL